MGNKRKALLIVIVVVLAAFTAFSCVPFFFVNANRNVSAGTPSYNNDKTKITMVGGSAWRSTDTFQLKLEEDAVYAVVFTGESGESGGYGATCLAFYKPDSSNNNLNWSIGAGGGSGGYYGGGYTNAYSNFALPAGTTADWAKAGGGGGGYVSSSNKNAVFKNGSVTSNSSGGSASQTQHGNLGSHNYHNINGYKYSWNYWFYNYSKTSSGGGAGYYNGGGGGQAADNEGWITRDEDEDLRDIQPGGGGSCSPNCYPIYANDTVLGNKSRGTYGVTTIYRIDPTTLPEPKNPHNTDVATIKPGEAGAYTMSSLSTDAGIVDLGKYIKTAWVYSVDGGDTWVTDPSEIKIEEFGVTKSVLCRYVMYAASADDTTKLCPSYKMKYTDAVSAASDLNYVVKEHSFNLTRKIIKLLLLKALVL